MSICFTYWLYKGDQELCVRSLSKLRKVYPLTEVIALSDGPINKETISSLEMLDCKTYILNSPKTIGNNDNFLFDRLSKFIEVSKADVMIRLDPDTDIHKRIDIPTADWFGQPFTDWYGTGTWGGACGLSRDTVKSLLKLSRESVSYTYQNPDGITLLSDDATLSHYANKILGIEPKRWADIKMSPTFVPRLLDPSLGITHPCLEKRIRAHMFEYLKLEDVSLHNLEIIAKQLNHRYVVLAEEEYNDINTSLKLSIRRPYRGCSKSVKVRTLTVRDKDLFFDSTRIGSITNVYDSWFSTESCELRKDILREDL